LVLRNIQTGDEESGAGHRFNGKKSSYTGLHSYMFHLSIKKKGAPHEQEGHKRGPLHRMMRPPLEGLFGDRRGERRRRLEPGTDLRR
jgi:hypothetical protein